MELPARIFAEIVGKANRSIGTIGTEQRRSARVPIALPSSITATGGPAIAVVITEISLNGIGIVLSVAMNKGDAFVVGLPRHAPDLLKVCCTATRCSSLGNGLFIVGATLDRFPDEPPTAA